jgi:hypothetical protein
VKLSEINDLRSFARMAGDLRFPVFVGIRPRIRSWLCGRGDRRGSLALEGFSVDFSSSTTAGKSFCGKGLGLKTCWASPQEAAESMNAETSVQWRSMQGQLVLSWQSSQLIILGNPKGTNQLACLRHCCTRSTRLTLWLGAMFPELESRRQTASSSSS